MSSAGDATSTGNVVVASGLAKAGASGSLQLNVGDAKSSSGDVDVSVGTAAVGDGGAVVVAAGNATFGSGGSIRLAGGSSPVL